MSRVALARIPSLTFYKGSETLARRSSPIPQLTCIGKPCKLYTPDVVRCVNNGGDGVDVDWRCEADLPEALRFGRVEVSCEGWTGPGDPYVLKGSCGLEYRLVQVPDSLRKEELHRVPWGAPRTVLADGVATILMLLAVSAFIYILYTLLKSCFTGLSARSRPRTQRPGGFWGSSWFPGGLGGTPGPRDDPPPPYTKRSTSGFGRTTSATAATNEGWRPGFWTGAALGGLGTYFMNRNNNQQQSTWRRAVPPLASAYDWEYERLRRPVFSGGTAGWGSGLDTTDHREGSSNLGQVRRSTGFGGSTVR